MDRRRRVLIVEDEAFVSDSLTELIRTLPNLDVVGAARTLREGRSKLEELTPDILVTDLFLEDGNGTELLRTIREQHLGTRVIVLTGARDAFAATEALAAGALGYVLKVQPVREFVEALAMVTAGRHYVSPHVAARLSSSSPDRNEPSGLEKLSRRELEVLRFVVAGHTSSEIARRLCISPKTIDTHRSNMYRKLALRNAVELMRFATAHGIGMPLRTP